jgi:hypothetical protein
MTSIERQVLDLIDAAEFRELAEWARAVPESLLAEKSPNAKHFERIARILEDLAKLDELSNSNGVRNDG